MRKKLVMMCIVMMAITGLARAQTIEWLARGDIGTWDAEWISLLESQGYTVILQPAEYETLDAAKIATLNSRDLIIASRTLRAARYDDGDEPEQWSNLTTPMLCLDATATDTTDWNWFNPGASSEFIGKMEVLDPAHPFFAGVTLDGNNMVDVIAFGNIDIPQETDAGNGTLLATTEEEPGHLWIAEWDAGVEYYTGSGITTGGPRVFYAAGANLNDGAAGGLNLNAVGQQIFLNIVYEMLNSDYDRAPIASASDIIANAGIAAQLDGTAFDFEGAALTIVWSQLDGPGTASFSDAGIEDPTVTFTAAGTYTLQISVDDGVNPAATDTCTCYVWDPADNALVGHWDFENLPEPNSLTDVTGNGFTGIWTAIPGQDDGDPNVTAGVLNDGASQAWDGSPEEGFWEVPNALTAANDPNFNDVKLGITFASWIKMPSTPTTPFPVIAAFGNGDNRMHIRANDGGLVVMFGAGADATGSRGIMDDQWHHVVGVFDGPNASLKVYIDGLLDAETPTAPGAMFSPDPELRIGNRVTDRFFYGAMDDLRIYNYPLSPVEITTLTAEGDVPPLVDAGEDQDIYFKKLPVQLTGVLLIDDQKPAPATVLWELTTAPLGVNPGDVIINNPTALDTTVTFPSAAPVEGTYTFTLTADDTAATVSDTVQIVLTVPTCADVIADGLTSRLDVAGGPLDGQGNPTPDCRVDMNDFAVLASEWLECVDPKGGPGCNSPY